MPMWTFIDISMRQCSGKKKNILSVVLKLRLQHDSAHNQLSKRRYNETMLNLYISVHGYN